MLQGFVRAGSGCEEQNRDRPIGLNLQRDELAKDVGCLQRHNATGTPQITTEKFERV